MAETLRKITELRGMTRVGLEQHLAAVRQELWQQRIKAKEGALQQTHTITAMRRHIARTLTVLRGMA